MASGSRGRGQGSTGAGGVGGDALDTLTNPDLARLPAADLVVRLNHDDRIGSDFADAALVLAVRERRLADAEDRIRAADVVAAGLRDTIRALELRVANVEALARRKRNSLGSGSDAGDISGGGAERAVARDDDDDRRSLAAGLEPQIGAAAELTGGVEIRARASSESDTIVVPEPPAGEIEIEDGEITPGGVRSGAGAFVATHAEVGDNMARPPSPLRRIGGSMPDELVLAEERAVERVVVEAQAGVVVDSREDVSEAAAGKRKNNEPEASSASDQYKEQQPLKKKPKPAGALDVASDSEDSDTQDEAGEELCFTEAEGWEMLADMEAQVAAWEAEYDTADAAQGTLPTPPVEEVQTVIQVEDRETTSEAVVYDAADAAQATLPSAAAATPPVEEVQTVIEVEARETTTTTREATVGRLKEQIILCERRLEEIENRAEETEERLCAEITECKEKAKTESLLCEQILLAHSSAVTELEVWKHSATEAHAQIRAASVTTAQLSEEIEAWKNKASESETRLQAQDKIIAALQDKAVEDECKLVKAECRIRLSDDTADDLQNKIEAIEQDHAKEVESQIRRATKIEEHLRARIRTLELKVADLQAEAKARGSSDLSRSDHRTVAIVDEHDHSRMMMSGEIEVHGVVPTGATSRKAQRQKGVSFYNEVLKSEMEKKEKLNTGNKGNEESLRKQAAVAASKELYLRCWSQAPYLPSQIGSQSAEEDSGGS